MRVRNIELSSLDIVIEQPVPNIIGGKENLVDVPQKAVVRSPVHLDKGRSLESLRLCIL